MSATGEGGSDKQTEKQKPARKLPEHLWKPGVSGNPKGRPPGTHARDLARAATDKAIETLIKALDDKRLGVQAAAVLLDRGWGKPKQEVEATNLNVNVDGGIDAPARPETLQEWLQRRKAELEGMN